MNQKKVPLRMCSGCMQMKPKKELIRVVKSTQKAGDKNGDNKPGAQAMGWEISLDATGKKPGRGAYLCRDPECLKAARKARRFEKAFSCKIPDELFERLEAELKEDAE